MQLGRFDIVYISRCYDMWRLAWGQPRRTEIFTWLNVAVCEARRIVSRSRKGTINTIVIEDENGIITSVWDSIVDSFPETEFRTE